MTEDEFIALSTQKQSEILISLAAASLPLLETHDRAYTSASAAVTLLQSHLVNPMTGKEVATYLTHDDLNQDLSALFDFVGNDEAAIAALDIISYATGANALSTYNQEGVTSGIPDPVLSATPDIVVGALPLYESLSSQGRVQPIDEVLAG